MNQNREKKLDNLRQKVEFEVNVRAEQEVTKILGMLHDIHKKLGINISGKDDELEEMKENLNIQELHDKINDISLQESLENSGAHNNNKTKDFSV